MPSESLFKSYQIRITSQIYDTSSHPDAAMTPKFKANGASIDPGRGVLPTITPIWPVLAKRIDYPGLGLTTAYSSLPFCPDISVYKSRIRDRI